MLSDESTNISCPILCEMEKNPAYEFISISTARSSVSDNKIDVLQPANIARPKQATGCQISGQTCVSAIFAVVAILALLHGSCWNGGHNDCEIAER